MYIFKDATILYVYFREKNYHNHFQILNCIKFTVQVLRQRVGLLIRRYVPV